MRYRGRFAPSPTGPLHFGSLIAALGSYCDARRAQGEWLLRIEDVDTPRSRAGAESAILRALERYGFEWDGDVVRQSERTDLYRAALERLLAQDDVFRCTCTRRTLEKAELGVGREPVYPGTCRARPLKEAHDLPRHAWRLRVDTATDITFTDRLQGAQRQLLARDVGDFVVQRSDGLFAYQLAVVVDDAEQHITDVVRGADLLSSTPRQIHLQQRLGYATPRYLHLPVAVNRSGAKLSKQTNAPALPDDGLAPLLAAWRFLDQPLPPHEVADVREFWAYALAAWNAATLPPVPMLPADRTGFAGRE